MFYIPQASFSFGTATKDQKIVHSFKYEGDFDEEVDYIQSGCGCTKILEVNRKDKTITFELDLSKAIPENTTFPYIINKGQSIFLDPGVQYFIPSGKNKLRTVNSAKRRINTSINGTVTG